MFDVGLMRWIDNQVGNAACRALATAKRGSSNVARPAAAAATPKV